MDPDLESIPENGGQATSQDRVRWLREQIAELRKRWPPHSVPAGMLLRLDDLEEELEYELSKLGKE